MPLGLAVAAAAAVRVRSGVGCRPLAAVDGSVVSPLVPAAEGTAAEGMLAVVAAKNGPPAAALP